MKLLMENWRKFLLTEAAKSVDDLVAVEEKDIHINIKGNMEGGIDFWYAIKHVDRRGDVHMEPQFDRSAGLVWGNVEIVPSEEGVRDDLGPCGDAWQVKFSQAADGWGPLLYDVAIEWATMYGGGLIADREQVSGEARAVWDYYLNKRGDVGNHQLDNLANVLTPEIEVDNCAQDIAGVDHGGPVDIGFDPPMDAEQGGWVDSALSKRYTKQPTIINQLEKLGRIIDES